MINLEISISRSLKDKCRNMALGTIACKVSNTKYDASLWEEIDKISISHRKIYTNDTIKTNRQIEATRQAYLACGKEPSRYRPSAEALLRRVAKGDKLYQINTLVDLINLVSIKTGFSIGAFNVDTIVGNVVAGIGIENEPYEAIGRGMLNIQNLPILRDDKGGIGTPTSDSMRTSIKPETTNYFVCIYGFTGKDDLFEVLDYTEELLFKYVSAKGVVKRIVE